jgi:hypothetical protein
MRTLTVEVYPTMSSTRALYEDDGASFDYEKGISCETSFKISMMHHQSLILEIGGRKGAFVPSARNIRLRMHGQSLMPTALSVDGKPMERSAWQFDETKKIVELELNDSGIKQMIEMSWR